MIYLSCNNVHPVIKWPIEEWNLQCPCGSIRSDLLDIGLSV